MSAILETVVIWENGHARRVVPIPIKTFVFTTRAYVYIRLHLSDGRNNGYLMMRNGYRGSGTTIRFLKMSTLGMYPNDVDVVFEFTDYPHYAGR